MQKNLNRVVISGGGTGGHIFPAIAIANEIKNKYPDAEILFVGAKGKMEMEKVPQAGYKIVGLPITGFQRRLAFSNFILPFKLLYSLIKAYLLLKSFKPEVVIGVGGYASGPILRIASFASIPTMVQEQNSFPGKTNRILSKVVKKICVAYDGLEKFFPKEKMVFTGNPVRNEMVSINGKREEAISFFGLDSNKKTILVIGGSLGARTLNESIENAKTLVLENQVQVLWQCGKFYYPQYKEKVEEFKKAGIHLNEFIFKMDLAYACADVIISRAGAISVSELTLIGKPVILVPSPNVSDDHQTKNALALVNKSAALLVKDSEAKNSLFKEAIDLLQSQDKASQLASNCLSLGIPNAAERIVNEIENII
ncbi:MAG: undecaprenyldiphospho-muramoylpentapeptide beta-N-acetylglucosaminyltransferase [Crocinitomicaceae bacterium]|jgi:UDP-N-acetylglucosamine--N-acetylmuramyl-(pentapeptide) pyrophosphoryl-undecaprenol N-acetylglucosamine transferase